MQVVIIAGNYHNAVYDVRDFSKKEKQSDSIEKIAQKSNKAFFRGKSHNSKIKG